SANSGHSYRSHLQFLIIVYLRAIGMQLFNDSSSPFKIQFTMKIKFKILYLLVILLVNAGISKAIDIDPGTLTGTITDKKDGSPIIGATVSIPNLKTGANTD